MRRPLSATDVLSPVPALKVGMISLGCAKNLVDAEIMLGDILAHGMEVTANADDADVVIINTCAFIDSAKEESIEAILDAHQERGLRKRPGQKLVVSGCMSQRFAASSRAKFPRWTHSWDSIKLRTPGKSFERSSAGRGQPEGH